MKDEIVIKPVPINWHFSFPRTGSTMFLSYMRANPKIETGFAEPNHLFRLIAQASRFLGEYKKLFNGAVYNAIYRPAVRAFAYAHFGKLMEHTGKEIMVMKHPWLVPHILEVATQIFPDSKVVLMHRHPYDTIASAWHLYNVNSNGNKVFGHYGDVKTIDDMCELYIMFLGHLLDAKRFLKGRALEKKYEDLIENPVEWLDEVYRHYGAPLPIADIEAIVERGQNEGLQMLGGGMKFTKLRYPVSNKWKKWLDGADRKKVKSKLKRFVGGLGYNDK